MGDILKITKDKRHRSSSSLAGAVLDSTRSERKLDVNVSIPEVEDQFTIAEARCDDLQDKIDLIKSLKRKKKLKKRSMTKVTEQPLVPDTMPMITVRTQPKKKVSQQAARLRRVEAPPNPTRGYLDPATVEQHRMIGQVRGYNNVFSNPHQDSPASKAPFTVRLPPNAEAGRRPKARSTRQSSQADGDRSNYVDSMIQGGPYDHEVAPDVACGHDERYSEYSHGSNYEEESKPEPRRLTKHGRRRHVPRDVPVKALSQAEERPVVELFSKNYASSEVPRQEIQQPPSDAPRKSRKARAGSKPDDEVLSRLETLVNEEQEPQLKKTVRYPRRVKYRNRRYELPTVASQMKQAGMRYYYDSTNHNNIPFVVSKSTAPSHNIGVNIQQVLNGLKTQQPLTGIPLTIAHHMGLGHVPTYSTKSAAMVPARDHREINAIKVGRRLLRLPSYKYVSYNRLLNLYREGDGMVPRFLRAMSRPHYFYTSMYNSLNTNNDFDGATSKGRAAGSQEAKQNLAEFACLYREYEKINKNLKEGKYDPELEQRKEELSKELALREQHIRKVVADYRMSMDVDQTLRASASTAEDGYRHSAIKFGGDAPN